MKAFTILLPLIFVATYTFSQESISTEEIDVEFYKELLNKEFTKILTGQNTNFGTYATLGTKDDIASLSGNIELGEMSNLNVNMKGGVTEGIIPLLNGENVSPKLSLSAQLNLGIYRSLHLNLEMDATKRRNYFNSVDSMNINTKRAKEDLDLLKEKTELELKQKKEKLGILKKQVSAIDSIISVHNEIRNEIKRDSINIQIKVLSSEIDYITDKFSKIDDNEIARLKQNISEAYTKFQESSLRKLSLTSYKVNWFSVFGNLNNRSFNWFDESAIYGNQLQKISYNRIELGFSYNIYQLSDTPLQTYFLSVGVSYLRDDNFDDLTKKTLNDKQGISSVPFSRSLNETQTVYLGTYNEDISSFELNANLYWFPSYQQNFAFHIQPSSRTNFEQRVRCNGIVGFLLGFKNAEKDKNIINVELFYRMTDIFRGSEATDDQLADRSSIGVNLNFPITFKNTKL